jgi:hypothetical protein
MFSVFPLQQTNGSCSFLFVLFSELFLSFILLFGFHVYTALPPVLRFDHCYSHVKTTFGFLANGTRQKSVQAYMTQIR